MKTPIQPSRRPAKILLVEDNDEARAALRRALEWFGHRVFTARNAIEARAIWDHQEGSFRVLVTDVVLPGPTGTSLARDLLDEVPGLRILFLSGYTDREVRLPENPEARTTFLEKPVTIRELGEAVEQLLKRDPPPAGAPLHPARVQDRARADRNGARVRERREAAPPIPPPASTSGFHPPGH